MDEKELVIEAVFKVAPLAAHKGPSERVEVDFCVRVLFINKKSALFFFFFFFYISVYFWLIGPQASRSPSCRISRVSRRSTFYFITPSKGMRGVISLGLTLRLLWETLSDQIFRPQQTPIIRIMASHGNKEKRGKTLPKHLNLFFFILF